MSRLLSVACAGAWRRAQGRAQRADARPDGDAGFSLIETVVSLSIFALLMTSVAVVFVGGVRSSADLQRRQVAATLAAQAIELARAVPPAPDVNLCPRLLQGRSQSGVTSQIGALPGDVDLSSTDLAWMPNTCTGSTVIPLQGLASTAGAAAVDPVRVDGSDYRVRTIIGTCRMPRAGGTCGPALSAPLDAVTLFRVVVSVTWSGVGCAQGCSYSAATLVDPSTDPLFNSRTLTPGPPVGLAAKAKDGQAELTWLPPATALEVPVIRYTATLTPNDGGSTRTCTTPAPSLTCTASGLTNGVTYVVSVVAESAYGLSAPSSTVTVIPYPAGIMTAARLKLWLDGADQATMFQDPLCTTPASVVAQQVGCWTDKSLSLNNAVQSAAGSKPTLSTVATRPVPGFNGSSSSLVLVPALLPIGTATGTILAVATLTDPAPTTSGLRSVLNHGTLLGGQARQIQKLANSTSRVVSVGTNAVAGTWTSAAGVVSGEFTASSITNWSDGGPGVTVTALTNSTGTTYARVGSSGTPSQFWQGAIPEVIVFLGALTSTERRTMEEYLARKWAGTITPQAPTGVAAVGGVASASVSWTPPAWDGGAAITSYTIVATPTTGATVTKSGCAASPCTVTGLTAAMTYSFTVAAVNSAGTGPASAPASATTLGGAGAPTGLVATPADGLIGIAWTPPASNGGSPITGYTVTATPAGGGSPVTCTTATTSCTLTGLTNGVAYTATVVATTAVGTSPASAPITSIPYPSALITPAAVKLWLDASDLDANGAVGGVTGETGTVAGAVQTWKDRSGGARDTAAPSAAERPSYTSRTINGLPVVTTTGSQVVNGVVSASPYGITADRTLVVVTRPRSWSSGTANDANGTFLVDRANGSTNAPLFGLKVCATVWCLQNRLDSQTLPGQGTAVSGTASPTVGQTDILMATRAGSTSTLTVTGNVVGSATLSGVITQQAVAVGRHYNLSTTQDVDVAEVLMFNKALSAGEQSTLQTYLGKKWGIALQPSAPTGVGATPGNAALAVSWTPPSFDGGSAIASYTVTAVPSDNAFPTGTCTSSTTSCTVTGLTNGVSYSVTVTATNATTTGPASSAVTSSPAAPFVLDGVGSTPVVAYGLRRLRTGYTGSAIGVRRSDGATTTIGFDASGNLDTTSLMAFCGTWWFYCYVATWYDQSGNGINATQSLTVRQPTITAAGVLKTANGMPTLDFSGGQNLVTGTSAVPVGVSTLTGNVVGLAQWYSGAGQLLGFAGSTAFNDQDNTRSAALVQRDLLSAKVVSYRNGATRASVSAADGVLASHLAAFDGTYTTIYSSGSASTPVASSGAFSATGAVTIGSDKDWTNPLSGDISEVTLFAAALSPADRSSLMANQRAYFATPTVVVPASDTRTDAVRPLPEGEVVSRSGLSSAVGPATPSMPLSRGGLAATATAAATATTARPSGGRRQ